jgi:molybdopterin guanine dinucleotide-containing S/N-oxide reductase-like protein
MSEEIFTQNTVGGVMRVYVKDGKIMRIRPIIFDETDAPSWTIEARGKKFTPPRKATIHHYAVPERTRIYSEKRIQYPLKRVDFNPKGKRNIENRGKSAFERISWDDALDLVAGEIKRIQSTYGKAALTACTSSHHNYGLLFYKMGPFRRFFGMLGYTEVFDNPDSWEGWYYGATHAWGHHWNLGTASSTDMLWEALTNTDMIVLWAEDPDSGSHMYSGMEYANFPRWLNEAGIKLVTIDCWTNYTAGLNNYKLIAPRPGTDAAMAEAIAYVWLKENTYDKKFIANRTVGFEEFKKQTLGKADGTPRTPGWAAEICDVPVHDIVALAREWAAKRTILGCGTGPYGGGPARQAYGTEFSRLLVYLLAMQGMGKPGVGAWGNLAGGVPTDFSFKFPMYGTGWTDEFSIVAKKGAQNKVTQKAYRILLPEIIMNPPVSWLGMGQYRMVSMEDQQFKKFTCPEPGPNGAPIKMFYRHGGSFISTMTDTNQWIRMYQHPNLEFVVNQDCWWSSETRFSDIILPASTNFEHSDISQTRGQHRVVVLQQKCIEPLWDSRPDYEIYCELARRLGFLEEYTEGNSREDWIKKVFDKYSLPQFTTWKEFKKKGYFVAPNPQPKDYKPIPAYRWFYEGRPSDNVGDPANPKMGTDKANELSTYSGKIEFVSQSLTKYYPKDKERPPLARYIPSWEGYDSKLAGKYPLQLISPHARFSYHTHNDDKALWLDEIPVHRVYKDGYPWWPIRIHPTDAEPRNIHHGDIVKMYNDRGGVLGIAVVTERMKPGVIHSYQASAKYDPLEPGKAGSIDKAGCVNLLSPGTTVSKNAPGMANNSCLVEICRWEV